MVLVVHEAQRGRQLPTGWRMMHLRDVAIINPRRPPNLNRADDAPTTFVPMEAVDEVTGTVARPQVRPFAEVKKGYTYFGEGDVLFAKITPCMQNGKHAVARNLLDGIGFGTTEFHVIRPGPEVMAEWIHLFARQPRVLFEATKHFTGTVGQQRVPDGFLAEIEVPLPPMAEQKRIVAILGEQLAAVERARAAAEARLEAAKDLPPACLRQVFGDSELAKWPEARLGDVLRLRKEVVHPYDNPRGLAVFVGLEHVESCTGVRTGQVEVEMSLLTGRKPRFYQGDIVYGYLRPYLNKVWLAEFDGLCSVDQYVFWVDADRAYAPFIAWFIRSPVYLERSPVGKTPGWLPRIRTEEVASVRLNLPPLAEQVRIAKLVEKDMAETKRLQDGLRLQLEAVNVLPAALLQRAFNGNV